MGLERAPLPLRRELMVTGTDIERVRKVYGEKRAQYLTDPALRATRGSGDR